MRKIQIKLNIVKEVTVRTSGDVRTSRGYEYIKVNLTKNPGLSTYLFLLSLPTWLTDYLLKYLYGTNGLL